MKNKIFLLGLLGTLSIVGCSRLIKIEADVLAYAETESGIRVDMRVDPHYVSLMNLNNRTPLESISVEADENFAVKGLSEDFEPVVYENIVRDGLVVESFHKIDFKFNYVDGVYFNESKLEEAEGTKYYLFAFERKSDELKYSFSLSIGKKENHEEIFDSLMAAINDAQKVEITTYNTKFNSETDELKCSKYTLRFNDHEKINTFKDSLSNYDKLNWISGFSVVPGERFFKISIRDESGFETYLEYHNLDKLVYGGSIVGINFPDFVNYIDMLIENHDEIVDVQEHILAPNK